MHNMQLAVQLDFRGCLPIPSLLPSLFVIGNAIFRRRAKSFLMTLTMSATTLRQVSLEWQVCS